MQEREGKAPNVFAIVDIETTGTRPLQDRIIDIAIIRVEDGKITQTLNTLVNPSAPLPVSIVRLSGISQEMVATAPVFDEVALSIMDILKDAIFVAHNAHFDYGFIKNEMRRIGISFQAESLCTVKLSRRLFPSSKNHDLDALIARHNLVCSERHRAYPDAHVLYQWMTLVQQSVDAKVYAQAIEDIMTAAHVPPLLGRGVLKGLPDSAGIYFFYGKDKELLYVGKSKNIRTRVRSHFSTKNSRKEIRLCEETASVEVQETTGELSALLLEAQTIKTHMPLYNRALRKARSIVVAVEEKNDDGYYVLRVEQKNSIPDNGNIAAIFKTMTQAKSSIRQIAKDYKLCPRLLGIENTKGQCFFSQIGICNGACIQKESDEEYNNRFKAAFKRRSVKTWPYTGPIMIEEKGEREGTGIVFFINNWCLIKSIIYDHGDVQDFISSSRFDYDTYKILARYILNPVHKKHITEVSMLEMDQAISGATGTYENVVVYH